MNKKIGVRQGESWFFVNEKGERTSQQVYEAVRAFESDGMCAVCMDGKWGFIDRQENLKIACAYEDARSFTAGYAAVKKNGIWGYVDEKGSMAVSPVFDDAGLMTKEGVAPVCHGDAWTLIQLKIMD